MNTKLLEQTYELAVYPRRDIVLVSGKGARLYDEEGREYIDCAANVGVSNIGHGHETVAKAIYEQYRSLGNCYGMFYNPVRARLAEKLAKLAPSDLNRVFFCNSGAEAIEGALKFARSTTGRQEIISAMRGFHGKTMGALAATWGPEYQKPFVPMMPGLTHVPFNNFAKLETALSEETAAVLLEIVQGEGGVRVGNLDYFQRVRELCHSKGVILIIDEVQTGFGRTGDWFTSQVYDVRPDIIVLGKAIANGLPLSGVGASAAIMDQWLPGSHGTTFGGNPVSCAASAARSGPPHSTSPFRPTAPATTPPCSIWTPTTVPANPAPMIMTCEFCSVSNI